MFGSEAAASLASPRPRLLQTVRKKEREGGFSKMIYGEGEFDGRLLFVGAERHQVRGGWEWNRLVALTDCLFAPNRLQMYSCLSSYLFVRMCLCACMHDGKEDSVLNRLDKSKMRLWPFSWKEMMIRQHVVCIYKASQNHSEETLLKLFVHLGKTAVNTNRTGTWNVSFHPSNEDLMDLHELFAQTLMIPTGRIPLTLMISWHLLLRHREVNFGLKYFTFEGFLWNLFHISMVLRGWILRWFPEFSSSATRSKNFTYPVKFKDLCVIKLGGFVSRSGWNALTLVIFWPFISHRISFTLISNFVCDLMRFPSASAVNVASVSMLACWTRRVTLSRMG